MDIVKTFLGGILAFALAYFIFDRFEQDRAEGRALCAQNVAHMQDIRSTFDHTMSAYRNATFNVLIELYRWRNAQPTEPMHQFWGPAYVNLDASLRDFEETFPNLQDEVVNIRDIMSEIYKILDNELIDPRLDRIENLHNQRDLPSTEDEWQALAPIPREELDSRRPKVEAALDALEAAQRSLAGSISRRLSGPTSEVCRRSDFQDRS